MEKQDFIGRPANETLDCHVRALTVASGRPYPEVHALFKAAGRKDGHRTKGHVTVLVAGKLGLRLINTRPIKFGDTKTKRVTVTKFLNDVEHVELCAAFIRGHGFGVTKGVVADFVAVSPRAIVTCWAVPR